MRPYQLEGRDVTHEVEEAHRHWFDPTLNDHLALLDAALAPILPELRPVADAFSFNLTTARHTVSLPHNTLFGHYLMDELHRRAQQEYQRIRSAAPGTTHEDAENAAYHQAASGMNASDFLGVATTRTLVNIRLLVRHRAVSVSSPLVLKQAVQQLWTTFEVLANDLFLAAVDARPGLKTRVQADAGFANEISVSQANLQDPTKWSVNRAKIRFRQLRPMIPAYAALLPGSPQVQAALTAPGLKLLAERRHVLVHNAGRVDQHYLNQTGDRFAVGDQLEVSPAYVARTIELVRDSGLALLGEVAKEM